MDAPGCAAIKPLVEIGDSIEDGESLDSSKHEKEGGTHDMTDTNSQSVG